MTTIATFGDAVEAHLARGRVEDAGIRTYLADENVTVMAWHLSNAIGGIKLQVADEDVSAALAALSGENGEESPEESDTETTTAILPAEPSATVDPVDTSAVEDEVEDVATSRELNAARALRGALTGFLIWPLQFYVFWLLLKILMSDERLNTRGRRNAIVATCVNIPFVLAMLLFLRSWGASILARNSWMH